MSYEGRQAYWQKINMPPIYPLLDSHGQPVMEGGSYLPSAEAEAAMKHIPLIRNYAKIQVTDATAPEDGFQLYSYAVIYYPQRGTVTPYRSNVDNVKDAFAFNNKGDVGTSWQRTSDFINEINAAGGNGCVTLREHGIHDSWSYPLKNENVIRWLTSQSLNGEGFLQEAQYPERSFLKIFLLFLLPITLIIFLIIALRRKQ